MRPNLSVANLASALAVIGTSAMISACGAAPPSGPVEGKEVVPATGTGTGTVTDPAENKCGAGNSCGAGKGGASCGGAGGCGASKSTPSTQHSQPATDKPDAG